MAGEDSLHSPARGETAPDPNVSRRGIKWNAGFGVTLSGFALIALFVWFPRDITSGFVETNQVGKIEPGDAFFPVLLACAILVLSLIDLLMTGFKAARNLPAGDLGRLTFGNLLFLARFHVAVLFGLIAMYVLGPAVVTLQNSLTGEAAQYRQLVDTLPYKYIGFVAGALIVTLPTIAWAEGRWSVRALLTVLSVVLVMIIVFDVLLRNVQLPPNADY